MKPPRRPKPKSEAELQIAEEQTRVKQNEIKYDLKDYTIEHIVAKFGGEEFYVPEYQRARIWMPKHKNRFIESLLLGLPIPFMFLSAQPDGRFEVVDGAQRICTLEDFMSDSFALKGLKELPALNGFHFSNMPIALQRRLKNIALRIVVLEQGTTERVRQEIFNRINTSGKAARPAEVRRGAYTGAFMRFIKTCAEDSLFRKLCPLSDLQVKHRENEELVLRFFAYSDRYKQFRHDVDKFLDKYVEDVKDSYDKDYMELEFQRMLNFVNRYLSPAGFAKEAGAKTTPRVRFEALAVGINLALRDNPNLVPHNTSWVHSDEFRVQTTTHASNSQPRLAARILFVKDALVR